MNHLNHKRHLYAAAGEKKRFIPVPFAVLVATLSFGMTAVAGETVKWQWDSSGPIAHWRNQTFDSADSVNPLRQTQLMLGANSTQAAHVQVLNATKIVNREVVESTSGTLWGDKFVFTKLTNKDNLTDTIEINGDQGTIHASGGITSGKKATQNGEVVVFEQLNDIKQDILNNLPEINIDDALNQNNQKIQEQISKEVGKLNTTITSTNNATKNALESLVSQEVGKLQTSITSTNSATKSALENLVTQEVGKLQTNITSTNNATKTSLENLVNQEVGKLHEEMTQNNQAMTEHVNHIVTEQVGGIHREITRLDDDIAKTGAHSAALAGLHPQDYDENQKFTGAAAVGHYKGKQALAVGGFYRPNEQIMLSVGAAAAGQHDAMFNLGVSYRFGKTGTRALSSDNLREQLNNVNAGNRQLRAELDASKTRETQLHRRMAQLEAQVQELRALIKR